MVIAIAALVGVGLILANVAGVLLLHQSLISRVDQQLRSLRTYGSPYGSSDLNRLRPPDLEPRLSVQFFQPDGSPPVVHNVPLAPPAVVMGSFQSLLPHAGKGPYTIRLADGSRWRVEVRSLGTGADLVYVVTGVSLAEVDATEANLILIDVGLTALVLAAIGVVAAALVRVGLRPLTRMEEAAAEIAGGDLSRRVEDADPHTESGRLGLALNTMLVRIETAMADKTASEQRLRQFLADAAHELRTPLTSIQGFAELYRRGGASEGPALDEAMGAIDAEVGRMRLLVNDLLMLARLDEERPLERRAVDLLAVAADAVRDAHVRVPARFVLLGPLDDDNDTFDPVTVDGDEARLRQVVTNLVANALQHTPDDAEIVVRVGRQEASSRSSVRSPAAVAGAPVPAGDPVAVLEVSDSGPGMAQADAERAFERLFRAEVSRSRRRGGAGLGLSIVSAIVQAHGGRVELYTAPGEGARFRVLLPAAPTQSEDDGFVVVSDEGRSKGRGTEVLSEDDAHSKVALR
jgi:two-component system OmpR family sensor kinase